MTADYIIKILKSCECLTGFQIAADYLGKENNSVCVAPCGGEYSSRLYCDGSGIFFRDFELYFRLSGGRSEAAQNRRFFETLSGELCDFSKAHTFPEFKDSEIPSETAIVEDAAVLEDELHSIKYKTVMRLYYFKKK